MIVVEAFRAIDHFDECKEFIIGHRKVLQAFDILNITSASLEWAFSPSSVIIIIRRKDTNEMLGGARLQMVDNELLTPLEEAVIGLDPKIHDYLQNIAKDGVAEICGLWNTRQGAKLGIGSRFLTRSALAVAAQMELKYLVMLCAPSTVSMATSLGSDIITELGDEGKFYYPKIDLIATAMIKDGVKDMSRVNDADKEIIEELFQNPNKEITIVDRRGNEMLVQHKLEIL